MDEDALAKFRAHRPLGESGLRGDVHHLPPSVGQLSGVGGISGTIGSAQVEEGLDQTTKAPAVTSSLPAQGTGVRVRCTSIGIDDMPVSTSLNVLTQ